MHHLANTVKIKIPIFFFPCHGTAVAFLYPRYSLVRLCAYLRLGCGCFVYTASLLEMVGCGFGQNCIQSCIWNLGSYIWEVGFVSCCMKRKARGQQCLPSIGDSMCSCSLLLSLLSWCFCFLFYVQVRGWWHQQSWLCLASLSMDSGGGCWERSDEHDTGICIL